MIIPTKIEIANGVQGWVWLEKWEERQRWDEVQAHDWGFMVVWKKGWRTIAKTLKTK